MNIIEAARSGYMFRRKGWSDTSRWVGNSDKALTRTDVLADDWEINKPKERYWKWVIKDKGGNKLYISGLHYDDKQRNQYGEYAYMYEFIQKIESEYIEV